MSVYKDLVDQFFTRYEHPVIEQFILGFSGIDPQKKHSVAIIDHELLNSLLGGNSEGHFHLTREQLDWIIEHMNENYPPNINPNQSIFGTADVPIQNYEIKGIDVR